MKKSTLSILTAVIAFAPMTAFAQQLDSTSSGNPSVPQAQDAQTSIQTNSNSGSAIGDANLVLQNANQDSYQQQLNLDAYGVPTTPNTQTAVQANDNAAGAIGYGNVIDQDITQTNTQSQVDATQYLPPHLQY